MTTPPDPRDLHRRLTDALYVEAMVLADEARAFFDRKEARDALDPVDRVVFACESLKITTRLMHVIAWLMTRRAVAAGELDEGQAADPSRALGDAPASDPAAVDALPPRARTLVAGSIELHRRAARIAASLDAPPVASPARAMFERLSIGI